MAIWQVVPFHLPKGSLCEHGLGRTFLAWWVFIGNRDDKVSHLFLGLLSILWVATGGTIASLPWLNYCATLALYCAFKFG